MNHDRPEIQKHPFAFAHAFPVPYGHFCLIQYFLDMLSDGAHMAVGVAMRDDKIVRNRGEPRDI